MLCSQPPTWSRCLPHSVLSQPLGSLVVACGRESSRLPFLKCACPRDGYAVEGVARRVGCVIGIGGVVEEEGVLFCVVCVQMIVEKADGVLEVHGSGFVQVVTRDVVRAFAGCADAAAVFDPARIGRGSMAAVGDEVVGQSRVLRGSRSGVGARLRRPIPRRVSRRILCRSGPRAIFPRCPCDIRRL